MIAAMKRITIGCLLAGIAACLIQGPASPSSPDSIGSATGALRDLDFRQLPPVLTPEATQWLLGKAGLDWPMKRPAHGHNYDSVIAVPSRDSRFGVLSSARKSEWGQYGSARYCLVDSAGHRLWTRIAEICAPPAVSDQGDVALLMLDGEAPSRDQLDTLRVDFIGLDGQAHGSARWGRRSLRAGQHYEVED